MQTETPMADAKKTRASSMYLQLRGEVMDGVLPPGTKLNIRELSDRFESGLSPVREALNRLSAEGLLQQLDNRGFSVRTVSVPELMDLTQARCWLNEIGLRKSIAEGDQGWEEDILVSCHRLSRTPRPTAQSSGAENRPWNAAHKQFHHNLIAACGSPWLLETSNQLFDAAERYRSLARLAGVSREDPRDEHKEIMDAVIDRRADIAVEMVNAHFERTATLVRTVLDGLESGGAR